MLHKIKRDFLLLFILAIFGACTRHTKTDLKTLVIGIGTEPKNLDPRYSMDLVTTQMAKLNFQRLIRINNQMMPESDLAESFEVEKSQKFTFRLRPHIQFHDGTTLTSSDIVFSFNEKIMKKLQVL